MRQADHVIHITERFLRRGRALWGMAVPCPRVIEIGARLDAIPLMARNTGWAAEQAVWGRGGAVSY